jgi:predicted DsbA family dithiol-disulfide isomerase
VKVEIWSDIVCPWCYIGKRRFEAALARFEHRDAVEVIWRGFELDPNAPRQREGSLDEMLARKYRISPAQVAAMQARVTEQAAAEGLEYHLDRARTANTFDAHRLIHLAAEQGLQAAMKERLLRAYFTEGERIGDVERLIALGAEVGVDAAAARAALTGDAHAAAVRADERRAAAFGITGVPFFAIDERYGVSGAQPADVLLEVLETAWAEAHPLVAVGRGATPADGCDDGSCPV